jgi:hypothetical protein
MADYDGESVLVHVTNVKDLMPPAIQVEEKEALHFSLLTFALIANARPIKILEEDPLRADAIIISADAPCVLCHSYTQASAPQNVTAGLAAPDGFYLNTGTGVVLSGTAAVWAVGPTATRISVGVNRRRSA